MAAAAAGAVTVADLMTRDVRTLDRNATLEQADALMQRAHIRHLPVVEDGYVVGMLSERDLFRSGLAAALGYGQKGRATILRSLLVKEVMSEPPVTVPPDTPLRDAAQLLLERKIGCLPVTDAGRLVGLLTASDLLDRVAHA